MASISWPTTCAAETQERRRNLYARARGGHVRFWRRYGSPPFIDDPLFRSALPPERLAVLRTTKHAEQAADPMRSTHRRMFETDKRTVKKLLDADVRLGFGTDSGGEPNRFFLQGWFEHRQMELLRDAGLSPMQIIQTFSKNNSEILGIDKELWNARKRQGGRPPGSDRRCSAFTTSLQKVGCVRVRKCSRPASFPWLACIGTALVTQLARLLGLRGTWRFWLKISAIG
jgi:hypothetical protein